jgi:hypothetical protein
VKTISLLTCATPYAGVIISAPTGFEYTNQVGGISCNHPRYEGIFIPTSIVDVSCDRVGGCYGTPIEEGRVGELNEAFRAHGIPVAVDRERLGQSEECWIPVVVLDDGNWAAIKGARGIYTTSENCD